METREASEASPLAEQYISERVLAHPLLSPALPLAAIFLAGPLAFGGWDERSDLDLRFLLPDAEHERLSKALLEARLWDPARDARLFLADREPFRRFPGAGLLFLTSAQLKREISVELPSALWLLTHSAVLQDPGPLLEPIVRGTAARFEEHLPDLRCEHYYRFRRSRKDLVRDLVPRRESPLLAIKRGEAIREALRLTFLAEGKPYPPDAWLEPRVEQETRAGESVVTAIRALLAARERDAVDHTSKVLRDRVIFALQEGGVRDRWLEQWWLWPTLR